MIINPLKQADFKSLLQVKAYIRNAEVRKDSLLP